MLTRIPKAVKLTLRSFKLLCVVLDHTLVVDDTITVILHKRIQELNLIAPVELFGLRPSGATTVFVHGILHPKLHP